jgi:hypothetical protein
LKVHAEAPDNLYQGSSIGVISEGMNIVKTIGGDFLG